MSERPRSAVIQRVMELAEQLRHAARDAESSLAWLIGDAPPAPDAPTREEGADVAAARALALERGIAYADAGELLRELDLELARRIPREQREKKRIVPLSMRGPVLRVASDEPGMGGRRLRRAFGVEEIEYVVVTPSTFHRLQWMIVRSEGEGPVEGRGPDDLLAHDVDLQAESVALFETLLVEAVDQRASDVHLEHGVDGTRVRFRVDGDLRIVDHYEISRRALDRLVRVTKVRADLDIAEHRIAQGGQYETRIGGRHFFVRVQTQPTIHGENAVMRLLPQDPELQSIELLGFSPPVESRYRRLLASPGGLVLVVGPTGSGKTTTLYAGLRMLAADTTRKVISVENPVEYACEGIQQVEVGPAFGFADAMRVFVRQDPDVILLGEVRDRETAREAIRASQTGHLVLTTLHCNDAVDAVQRLFDLDMLPNSVASELLAVFAQRLVKKLCVHCREPAPIDPEVAAEVFPFGAPDGFETHGARGCDACEGTGFHGRTAVVEYLPVDSSLKAAITRQASLEELRDAAYRAGLVSLRERAIELVAEGVIDFATLPRFIPIDRLAPWQGGDGKMG